MSQEALQETASLDTSDADASSTSTKEPSNQQQQPQPQPETAHHERGLSSANVTSLDELDDDVTKTHTMKSDATHERSTSDIDDSDEGISKQSGFRVGFFEDKNKKYRRTMEDAHSFLHNFGGIQGCGWFAIYDGHAGKTAAEFCGTNLHEIFLEQLKNNSEEPVSELLNKAFLETDKKLAAQKGVYSGCTAATAYLQIQDENSTEPSVEAQEGQNSTIKKKRILYTANVGDARSVLCRNGKAIRLSYDHKGSDPQEAQRISEAGGFVLNNRVNGVLAVTRSLGDVQMKEWVIGNPYTAQTDLTDEDTFLIVACDGIWDVCSDQQAVDLIKDEMNPQQAAEDLLEHAIENFSTDNLSVIVVRFDKLVSPASEVMPH